MVQKLTTTATTEIVGSKVGGIWGPLSVSVAILAQAKAGSIYIQSSVQVMAISEEVIRSNLRTLLSYNHEEPMRESRKERAERKAKEEADDMMERAYQREEAKRKFQEAVVRKKRKLAEAVENKFETQYHPQSWISYFTRH